MTKETVEYLQKPVSVERWFFALIGGVPSITVLIMFFNLGSWKTESESKMFDSAKQKDEVLMMVNDPARHLDNGTATKIILFEERQAVMNSKLDRIITKLEIE